MRCNQSRQLIDAHVDGQLSLKALAAHETHLAECVHCAALFDATRRVADAARQALEISPLPDDFARRVLDAVAKRPNGGLRWRGRRLLSGDHFLAPHR